MSGAWGIERKKAKRWNNIHCSLGFEFSCCKMELKWNSQITAIFIKNELALKIFFVIFLVSLIFVATVTQL